MVAGWAFRLGPGANTAHFCAKETSNGGRLPVQQKLDQRHQGLSQLALAQYLLRDVIAEVITSPDIPDSAVWIHEDHGTFSVKSAYNLFFATNHRFACASAIWKSKAPPCCKFFMWLAVHRRCLTVDNLALRGWPHSITCQLCRLQPDCCTHLFVHCRFTGVVWNKVRGWAGADFPIPGGGFAGTEEWWINARKAAPKAFEEGFRHRRSWCTGGSGRRETRGSLMVSLALFRRSSKSF